MGRISEFFFGPSAIDLYTMGICPVCRGDGWISYGSAYGLSRCSHCGGTGRVEKDKKENVPIEDVRWSEYWEGMKDKD